MVADARQYNFVSVIDDLFSLKPLTGTHAATLRCMVEDRAKEILAHPDVRYMPAFKILDLLTDLLQVASALDSEPQLRTSEATALLRQHLAEDSPRLRQFLLDAALERARYEPMMILGHTPLGNSERDITLRKRWHAMRAAHQSLYSLSPGFMEVVEQAVERTIAAVNFSSYRVGPLMQYFAEMLDHARQLHREHQPPEALQTALAEGNALWKRYALKPQRYRSKKYASINSDASSSARPTWH